MNIPLQRADSGVELDSIYHPTGMVSSNSTIDLTEPTSHPDSEEAALVLSSLPAAAQERILDLLEPGEQLCHMEIPSKWKREDRRIEDERLTDSEYILVGGVHCWYHRLYRGGHLVSIHCPPSTRFFGCLSAGNGIYHLLHLSTCSSVCIRWKAKEY